jgi:hypothetical protein
MVWTTNFFFFFFLRWETAKVIEKRKDISGPRNDSTEANIYYLLAANVFRISAFKSSWKDDKFGNVVTSTAIFLLSMTPYVYVGISRCHASSKSDKCFIRFNEWNISEWLFLSVRWPFPPQNIRNGRCDIPSRCREQRRVRFNEHTVLPRLHLSRSII